jgi:hypothetical protein
VDYSNIEWRALLAYVFQLLSQLIGGVFEWLMMESLVIFPILIAVGIIWLLAHFLSSKKKKPKAVPVSRLGS